MARQKQAVQEIPQSNNIEVVYGRVKKDVLLLIICMVVSMGAGLLIGNFFK